MKTTAFMKILGGGIVAAILPLAVLAQCPPGANASAGAICLTPQASSVTYGQQCWPLGGNQTFQFVAATPAIGFSGFIYRNVPAFSLPAGSRIRFDLGYQNDVNVNRSIFLAKANKNPAACPTNPATGITAAAWTKVVDEKAAPLTDNAKGYNPKGDTTLNNYELVYVTTQAFDFQCDADTNPNGCGLLIGFQGNPPATYGDAICDSVIVGTDCNDPSGKFHGSFVGKSDQTTIELLDVPFSYPTSGELVNSNNLAGVILEPALNVDVSAKIDIKFCGNPNSFNCGSQGKTPVTIFGGAGLDVGQIDIASLRLCSATACTPSGPTAWSIADRGNPNTDLGASRCAVVDGVEQKYLRPDGILDLDIGFDTPQLAGIAGCPLPKRTLINGLYIKGQLKNGTPFQSAPVAPGGDKGNGIDDLWIVNQ